MERVKGWEREKVPLFQETKDLSVVLKIMIHAKLMNRERLRARVYLTRAQGARYYASVRAAQTNLCFIHELSNFSDENRRWKMYRKFVRLWNCFTLNMDLAAGTKIVFRIVL